ncbi:MAG: hypothetical protein WC595_04825 [Candidatus Nanoarchaeia archaeon]
MEELPFFVRVCDDELRAGETSALTGLIFSEGLRLRVSSFIEGQRMMDKIAQAHLQHINFDVASIYLVERAMQGFDFERVKRRIVFLYGYAGSSEYVSAEARSCLWYVAKVVDKFTMADF